MREARAGGASPARISGGSWLITDSTTTATTFAMGTIGGLSFSEIFAFTSENGYSLFLKNTTPLVANAIKQMLTHVVYLGGPAPVRAVAKMRTQVLCLA